MEIFTDGACRGNPGPGGYGVILRSGSHCRELNGGFFRTTNNRMELTAVIEGLSALTRFSVVELYSDSQYVLKGLKEWMPGWKKKGWKTASKQPVKNVDLWKQLDTLKDEHEIRFHWVKGHAGHPENERVDELAVIERDKFARR